MAGIKDYYSIGDGLIKNKILEGRSFILSSSVWSRMEDRLYNDFGSGASVILFDMGLAYGISLVDGLMKAKCDETARQQNAIDILSGYATVAGWGKVIAPRIEGPDIRVKVISCVFCSNIDQESSEGRCYFLKGVLSGVAGTIFSVPFTVTESHCSKEYCEFTLQRKH